MALNIFPHSADDVQTTSSLVGVSDASSQPDAANHSAVMAIDGLPATAWETNYAVSPVGKYWQVTTTNPVTTNHITIAQAKPVGYQIQQWITKATLTFDGGSPVTVTLGPASRTAGGQTISFGSRTFSTLKVTIDDSTLDHASPAVLNDASPVGLAEVGLAGVQAEQVIDMPGDVLGAVGSASQQRRLVLVMTRQQIPPASDPEPTLARAFSLPTQRSFSVVGSVQLSSLASDAQINAGARARRDQGLGGERHRLGHLAGRRRRHAVLGHRREPGHDVVDRPRRRQRAQRLDPGRHGAHHHRRQAEPAGGR